jgi:hypothetical protein
MLARVIHPPNMNTTVTLTPENAEALAWAVKFFS